MKSVECVEILDVVRNICDGGGDGGGSHKEASDRNNEDTEKEEPKATAPTYGDNALSKITLDETVKSMDIYLAENDKASAETKEETIGMIPTFE